VSNSLFIKARISKKFSEERNLPIQKINDAYERMLNNDVKYRFVIGMASIQ